MTQYWLERAMAFLPKLIASLVVFVLGLAAAAWLAPLTRRALERRKVDHALVLLFEQIVRWSVVTLTIVVALQQVGFDVTAFLTGLGVLGFTVGFAIQDVSKNFVAGVLLLLQRPFDLGDAIEVAGYAGVVEGVTLRATEIRTWDGRLVYLPNAEVYTNPIVNYTRAARRRVEVTVGVAYGTDLEQARRAALEAVVQVPGVLTEPAPEVAFHTFGASSVDCTVYFWIDTEQTNPRAAKDQAVVALHRVFAERGIEIPYPIQTVYLHRE